MGDTAASKGGMPEVTLSSGHKMQMMGFGTAPTESGLPPPEVLTALLVEAIKIGYRHFDTASFYGSEESLGRAVAVAIEQQIIKSRDEVFITSKLWITDTDPGLVLPALKKSLGMLGLEYLDLYLIHSPVRMKEGAQVLSKENILEFDLKGTWEAMEECSKLGLAKSIGVSNFGPKKLSQILQFCTIPPAVNEVEMHVAWKQEKLREFCKEKGIHVTAWAPLAASGTSWGSTAVMDSPILKEIAEARGTTVAQNEAMSNSIGFASSCYERFGSTFEQVALRWVYQQGSSMAVKSFNKERMKENLGIFEWERELTEDELEKIKQIPPNQGFRGHEFVTENGPGYKSVEELWE